MSILKLHECSEDCVFAVMGIDANENDRLLAVCSTFERAKKYCIQCSTQSEFYDIWIERHIVL